MKIYEKHAEVKLMMEGGDIFHNLGGGFNILKKKITPIWGNDPF